VIPLSLVLATLATLVTLALGVRAADAQQPTLTPDDYGQWETLGGFDLDPTGTWLVASIRRIDESTELRLRRADGTGEPRILEHGSAAAFSADGRWMVYRKGVSPDEREAAEEPVRDRLGLADLAAGTDTVLMEITRVAFRDDGAWIAALGVAPADTVGADLAVFQPGGAPPTVLGNVDAFSWQDEGDLLAATLRTASGDANGVVTFDPDAGTLRTLTSAAARFRAPTWRVGSDQLGVLRSTEHGEHDGEAQDVLVWSDARTAPADLRVLASAERPELGDTLGVNEHAGIRFSPDGGTVFVGVRTWPPADSSDSASADADDSTEGPADDPNDDPDEQPDEAPDEEDDEREDDEGQDDEADDDEVGPADVQVWHWNDDVILRGQEARADFDARRTHLTAWRPSDDRLLVLGEDYQEPVQLVGSERRWGLVPDYDPYHVERRFGSPRADWYRVDVRTGERTRLAEGLVRPPATGPDGRHALLFHDAGWTGVDLASLARVRFEGDPDADVTGAPAGGDALPDFLMNPVDYDTPGPRPPWGVGPWIAGEEAAILHGKYDLWRADLGSGELTRLTEGGPERVRHRALNLDPDNTFGSPTGLDPDAPLWMSLMHMVDKTQGYAVRDAAGAIRRLVWSDARVVGLTRAADADRYAWRSERWDDSPDVFSAGPALADAVQVTATNPFQSDFAWGRTELLHYTTDAGHELQAILSYPADFREGERYPLILYQYERLSDGLHAYRTPNERTVYDYQTWTQRGYFVLMPDIVYEAGRPGPSALDAVEHALDAALATGHVDAERMGLIGHSWGGYQAAYLPTRTHRFAASVAGAAITDFISFPGTVHWSGGLDEFGHWETGQARMARPPWQDLEGHLESSPINFIDQLETPVLLMHGDDDGVVDFRQGLQYYSYGRRAGKPVVMLMYPGAGHGLSDEKQQVDYHRRILEWFGHYLKGDEAARWIVEGESWSEREKRVEGG
jgi:dienelactone hydrolase